MITMPFDERRAYTGRLWPYLKASLILFGAGLVVGLMIVSHFPFLADHFEDTIASFVGIFSGMSRFKLAGAIFFNNALKTLLAILLGTLLGIVPGIFLLANGVALGVAWSLSSHSRGPWLALLSILPHGMIELPAVFLGTSIGLMIGTQALQRLFGSSEVKIGGEVLQGLRYFCTVIVPLLFAAAFVEAFVTAALISLRYT
jgi:stage II sporulation protein M